MGTPTLVYPTLEAYYAADERRRRSEEADYGVHWRFHGWEYRWRVSYVRNTGEIYPVHQGATIGPVFILGYVPPDRSQVQIIDAEPPAGLIDADGRTLTRLRRRLNRNRASWMRPEQLSWNQITPWATGTAPWLTFSRRRRSGTRRSRA